ncbi:MAG: glycoside hydrolase [Candidatus Eisenbacteria bacterium]|uniref:Glycoside hydrolase n=1 Tax=Eiseniibacteriota bacterium TaxID=2212470 RepID=A0A9D6QJA2_UNCEI|nr:glycoside hydrolase [Candidatus Eisenbacteria bacterium]MBI3539015.1 glycoside hydrolase [Candidatus Eisenbacteria bacterium]
MSEPLAPVDLVLLWHHHQPDYRDPADGRSVLPWTRLHATKDYLDMAWHVARHPGLRVTFNLVPSLIDQLEAVAAGAPDRLFDLIARPVASLAADERATIARRCAQAPPHAFDRWPSYRRLRDRAAKGAPTDAELRALEVWFLLAWIDPVWLNRPEGVVALAAVRAAGDGDPAWTDDHRDGLLALHRRLVAEVLPAYRALAESGRVEIATSPYDHPILPLLVDNAIARRARPDLALPAQRFAAPEDAQWQVTLALDRHASAFGRRPAGMWPSEGSVSPEVVAIAAACGVRWIASDEGVLWASLPEAERRRAALYRPWRAGAEGAEATIFFRDHELSDRIGFVYARWDPRDAAADFVARVRAIGREHAGAHPPVVTVILDGENCWEQYADDGGPFLTALYDALAAAPDIRTRTPSQVLDEQPALGRLEDLHSGSWIDADFHIWIGHPEKNRAWDLLARTRRALLESGATHERAPDAWAALRRAEGSDWFWWLGDDHPSDDRAVFDRLFRDLLRAAHARAGLEPPVALDLAIARGDAAGPAHQTPIGLIHPRLDGRSSGFYEWYAAGRYAFAAGGGAMHREAGALRSLHYGFDLERLCLRLDFVADAPPGASVDLSLEIAEPRAARIVVRGLVAGERAVTWAEGARAGEAVTGAACRIADVLEIAVPFATLGLASREVVRMLVRIAREGRIVEIYPGDDGLAFTVPGADFDATMWSA